MSDTLGKHPHNTAKLQKGESLQGISCFREQNQPQNGLEGTFKGHLVLSPCIEQGHLHLDQVVHIKAPSAW